MKKAYSYIRFSSEKQRKGESIRRQERLSEKYCIKNDLELVKNYSDLGVSAFDGKNMENALGRMLEAIRNGQIETGSYLLVESLDRLSRDKVLKSFSLFSEILSRGVVIVTCQDEQVYTDESLSDNNGAFLFTSLGIMLRAHNESATKSKRCLSAWDGKRKSADTKIITSVCPAWLKPKTDRSGFDIIQENANTVKRMFELAIEGNGYISICRILNSTGVKAIAKKSYWNLGYIKRILHNKAVFGLYTFSKSGETIENYYPEIISKELFDQAQIIFNSRNRQGGKKGKNYNNLFSHLIVCGHCGSVLHFKSYAGLENANKDKDHLICSQSYIKAGNCTATKINYNRFEELIFEFITEIDINSFFTSDNDKNIKTRQEKIRALEIKNLDDEQKIAQVQADLRNKEYSSKTLEMIDKMNIQIESDRKIRGESIKTLKDELRGFNVIGAESLISNINSLKEHFNSLNDIENYSKRVDINQRMKNIISNIEIFTYKERERKYTGEGKKEIERTNYIKVNFKNGKTKLLYTSNIDKVDEIPEDKMVVLHENPLNKIKDNRIEILHSLKHSIDVLNINTKHNKYEIKANSFESEKYQEILQKIKAFKERRGVTQKTSNNLPESPEVE